MKKKLLILSLLASFTLSPIVGKADFSLETHEESATLISAIDNQSNAMSSEQNSSVNLSLNATDSNLSSDSEVEDEFVAIQNLSETDGFESEESSIENDSDDELFESEKEDFQESDEEENIQDVEEFLEEKDGATETETVDNMVKEGEETQTLTIKEVNMQDLFDRSVDEDYLQELEEYFYSKLANDEKLWTYFYKNLQTDPTLRRYFSADFDMSEMDLSDLDSDEKELRAYFYQMIKDDADLATYFYHRLGETIEDTHTILYKKKKGGSSSKSAPKSNSKPAKTLTTTAKPVKQVPKSNNQGQKSKGKSGVSASNKGKTGNTSTAINRGNSSKSSGKGNNKSSSANSSKGNSTKGSTTSNKGATGSKSGYSQKGNNQPNKSKSGASSLDKAKQGVKQANDKLVKHTQDNHKVINANNTYQATGYFYQPQTAKDKQIIATNNQLKQGVAQAQQKVVQEVNKFHYTNVYDSITKTGKRPDGTTATEVEKKIAPHIQKIDAGLKVVQTTTSIGSAYVAHQNYYNKPIIGQTKTTPIKTTANQQVSKPTSNQKSSLINNNGTTNINSKTINQSSQAIKNVGGETVAGHALQKHAGRNPQIWGKVSGNSANINNQAQNHIKEILNSPGEFKRVTNQRGVTFLEKQLSDGRGIRLNQDGTFKGFIDQVK